MKKIDWKRKLTSRKFWLAIVGFVTPLLLAFGISQELAAQVAGIIMSAASCIAYIVGEGMVDAAREETTPPPDGTEEEEGNG